jgi:hypothetical protein
MEWTGGQIGTGFTNLYFTEGGGTAQQAADAARAFFNTALSTGSSLPVGITIKFPTAIDILEPATGILLTSIPVTTTGPMTGGDPGGYAAPAGICTTWRTSGVVNGHRVQGRTFLVPLGGASLQTDGSPTTAIVNAVTIAAAALIAAAPELVVWHRPASVALGGGEAFPVLAPNVRDTVAMLTSRR